MSYESEPSSENEFTGILPIGHSVLDHLRGIQIAARTIPDLTERKQFVSTAILEAPTDDLLGEALEIETATVLGSLRQKDKVRRFKFLDGMRFIGRAASCNYLTSLVEPIACVAVSFQNPYVLEPDSVGTDYNLFTFQVPVLSIAEVEPV
jgi:hypothetical protein